MEKYNLANIERSKIKDKDVLSYYDSVVEASNNFTEASDAAYALDKTAWDIIKMLAEIDGETAPKPKRTPTKRTPKPSNAPAPAPKPPSPADPPRNAVTRPVQWDDLSDELQDRLEAAKVVRIKIDIPGTTTPAADENSLPPIYRRIIDDIALGNNVMLIGGAGTGKTTLAERIADLLGRGFQTINCSQWTSPGEIIGGDTITGYRDGKMIDAWRAGQILILDELPKLDPNTAGLLNDALAKTGNKNNPRIANAKGDSIPKHPDFGVIATGNVYPSGESIAYAANNKQDLSLLDRFVGNVYFIEIDEHSEQDMLGGNMLIWHIADKMRKYIEKHKIEAQVSRRIMLVCLSAYTYELHRLSKGEAEAEVNKGKTFKSVIDSYISTFDQVTANNLSNEIGYDKIFGKYQYRKLSTAKNPY